MYLGVNRDNAVEKSILGFGTPGTFFAPGVVEDLEALRTENPAFASDRSAALAEAQQLLTEAGYPDGFEVTLNVVNGNPALSMAESAGGATTRGSGASKSYCSPPTWRPCT